MPFINLRLADGSVSSVEVGDNSVITVAGSPDGTQTFAFKGVQEVSLTATRGADVAALEHDVFNEQIDLGKPVAEWGKS